MLGVVELLFEFIIEIIFEGAICGFFGLLAELISAIFGLAATGTRPVILSQG